MKKPQNTTFTNYMKIGAVIAAVFVIFMEVRSCTKEKNSETDSKQTETIAPKEEIIRERAFYASKTYVREALSDADSIAFPPYVNDKQVSVAYDNNLYIVEAWADEIDASGINVRHKYKAEMKRIDERDWSCRSLILDDEVVK